jgi:hypothetical protein
MFPYLVILLAIVFLFLKFSGLLDEFTDRMQRLWGPGEKGIRELLEPLIHTEEMDNRLEVYRDFLDQSPEDDEGSPQE